jgi:hypothetical protein
MAWLGMSRDGSVGSARDGLGCRDGSVGSGRLGTAWRTYKICTELRGASDDVFVRVKP